jgi:DNA-binding beta-propeller fold protein YncE
MYVSSEGNNIINRIKLNDNTDVLLWANIGYPSYGLAIYDNYMYAVNRTSSKITRILMNNPGSFDNNWAQPEHGISEPTRITIDNTGQYMYVANAGDGTVTKITVNNVAVNYPSWASGFNYPNGLTLDPNNSNLYVINSGNNTISAVTVSNPMDINLAYVSGLYNPIKSIIDNSGVYMYVLNDNSTISRVLMSNTKNITLWITNGLDGANNLIIDNSNTYLYVSNYNNNTISRIDIANQTVTSWADNFNGINGLAIDNSNTYIYAVNQLEGTISRILISDTPSIESSWISRLNNPQKIIIDSNSNFLYVSNGSDLIYRISLSVPCFNKNTKILTNKGYQMIQDLKKGDMIKTFNSGYKPINIIGCHDIIYNKDENIDNHDNTLYCLNSKNYPELFEELIITGNHSILIDIENKNKKIEKNRKTDIIEIIPKIQYNPKMNRNKTDQITYISPKLKKIGNKYRLPAYLDKRANKYDKSGQYTVYHLALNNISPDTYDGIYANGLLVESSSINDLIRYGMRIKD